MRTVHQTTLAPHTIATRLGGGSIASTLRAAQNLGLWDLLESAQGTTAELASAVGTPAGQLETLLQALTNLGMIRRLEQQWMSVSRFAEVTTTLDWA